MAKQLNTDAELGAELNRSNITEFKYVHARIRRSNIAHWKKQGYLKFLRSQLRGLDNVKYSCVDITSSNGNPMRDFYFFMPTQELTMRVMNMVGHIMDNDQMVPLMKCSSEYDEHRESSGDRTHMFSGDYTVAPACSLQ